MERVKRYERMKQEFTAIEGRIIGLEGKLRDLNAENEPLSDEVLKLEILEDPRAEKRKKELQEMRKRRPALKNEIEEAKKKKQIMVGILNEYRTAARDEINKHYMKLFEERIKVFAKKLKEAEELESELVEFRKEARLTLRKRTDASESQCKIPTWTEVLLPSMRNGQMGETRQFVKYIASNTSIKIE